MAEKTGYPPDMLEMDLDLEADLGVDTVKQAETFAAVREEYGIERQESLKLRDFPTLLHVVQFVYDFRPDLKPSEGAGPSSAAGASVPTVGASNAHRCAPGSTFGRKRGEPRRPEGARVSSPTRPATPRTCWRWTWTSRRTSGWTP